MSTDARSFIQSAMTAQGFSHWDWLPMEKPLSIEFYQQWLKEGLQGEMKYLEASAPIKADPRQHFQKVQSMIVLSQDYFPVKSAKQPLKNLKIAHYAQDEDYHFWLRQKIAEVCKILKEQFPNDEFLAFTDAVPLLERDHAYQAGLGWVGKNTCLINRKKGSLFFIGEILTTLPNSSHPPLSQDFCGTCTKCIDECPTNAITEPRVLDAKKCIAYWNIEAKSVPPADIRDAMGDWFFGCDVCQTVCPWNVKLHKGIENFSHNRDLNEEDLCRELRWILETSNKQLMRSLGHTPLSRAGGRGLKRNAIIVAGNKKMFKLKPVIENYLQHPELAELAAWALDRL